MNPAAGFVPSPATTCIAECVDDAGRPVPDGTASARVLVTSLHNLTRPLIRYELTDRFIPAAASAGGFLRASVEGRNDDIFRYGATSVHPPRWPRHCCAPRRCASTRSARRRRDLRRQLRSIPFGDPMDPGYRRLKYIRYADLCRPRHKSA